MEKIIEDFYRAFARLDAEAMAACYHEEVMFEDPAFGPLKGEKAKNMWRMLCNSQKGKDFRIEFSGITADNNEGKAHWEAYYTFSRTGRKVHNKIDARFTFRDGKIIEHNDVFNLYRWSKQALGFKGYLLGWTAFFKRKLNAQTNTLLSEFENRENTRPSTK